MLCLFIKDLGKFRKILMVLSEISLGWVLKWKIYIRLFLRLRRKWRRLIVLAVEGLLAGISVDGTVII
jgi:hypothetical protein